MIPKVFEYEHLFKIPKYISDSRVLWFCFLSYCLFKKYIKAKNYYESLSVLNEILFYQSQHLSTIDKLSYLNLGNIAYSICE